ncbi:S26 family signal peptidase [Croceicoccus sp. YJ47]|uniref:S26 family signal peptidase n=1 Tax=Croceicoccus sp. YJ47 TaxID=2798724 RepID=UPI001F310AAC|nr:S26 family signal peptidase [Croceicoccus sp. YJ47]
MRRRTAFLAGMVAAATLASVAFPLSRLFVWNATASVPIGLYSIGAKTAIQIGDRVAIEPSSRLQRYLASRGYLPAGIPLIKEVAALGGDTVCRHDLLITINGTAAGAARRLDSLGRELPVWEGCRTIAADELFAMNTRVPGSFDGRYFGPVARADVIGRARPVWTDEAGNGNYVLLASLADFPIPNVTEGDAQ